ncbi:MAG: hypothetical protein AAF125_05410, partial [Chloroflexota bacterium]
NLLSVARNTVNFRVALDVSIGLWPFVIGIVLGALAWGRTPREARPSAWWLALLLPFIIANVMLTSSVVYASPELGGYGRVRFVFPAGLALATIWAVALATVWTWLSQNASRVLALVAVGGAALWIATPALIADVALVREYARTDTTLALWRYSDASLPNDGGFLTPRESPIHLTWNRPYSGYDGRTFTWAYNETPWETDPVALFADGTHYVAYTVTDPTWNTDPDALATWTDNLYPLARIDGSPQTMTGPTVHIYRTLPPATAADVSFGEGIQLDGYDLTVGETEVTFRPYWQATATPPTNYSMSLQLTPTNDPTNVIAQWDGPPARPERLPTTWDDPDEHVIGTAATVVAQQSGDYTLNVILYDFETGTRLPVGDDDSYRIPLALP